MACDGDSPTDGEQKKKILRIIPEWESTWLKHCVLVKA